MRGQSEGQSTRPKNGGVKDRKKSLAFSLETLYLFTKSDLPTSTGINTTFAIAGILAGPSIVTGPKIEDCFDIGKGVLIALYFTWHLTLCFNLGNQRQPQSAIEDGTNKPWRPIPSGRITPEATRNLQMIAISTLLILCVTVLGAWQETSFYLFCTWLYNERSWGDKSWWQRALMNACGVTSNRVASLHVAVLAAQGRRVFHLTDKILVTDMVLFADKALFTDKALVWFLMSASIIFTTIQVQDLRDQEGDALIKRQTLPLILGDAPTRWITSAAILIWSVGCPRFWCLGIYGYLIPVLTAAGVIGHMLIYRTRKRDHVSFRLVAVWWVSLYFLPMMKAYGL